LGPATRRSNDSISTVDRKFINADRYDRCSGTVETLKRNPINRTIITAAAHARELATVRLTGTHHRSLPSVRVLKTLRVGIKVLINLNADSLISNNVCGRRHNDCGDGSKQRHRNCDLPTQRHDARRL
jgi:hypothetical protein